MFKLRNFESKYSGNATEAPVWVYYTPSRIMLLPHKGKRRGGEVYNITRRGQAFVAYPYLGAMREPDDRDRRERDILPRLFCFHNFNSVNDE